jgi:arginyl-tRNA synthetase
LWNKGKEHTHLRFIDPKDTASTLARMALIFSVATIIKTGLQLLGIKACEEMR